MPDDDIFDRLRARFGVEVETIECLPLGYDSDARVCRVHARDGDRYQTYRRAVPAWWPRRHPWVP